MKQAVVLLLLAAAPAGAVDEVFSDGFEAGSTWEWSATQQVILAATPYQDVADIDQISGIFCMVAPCPWDPPERLHDGIDLHPVENLVPFQAGCAGTVDSVDAFLNPGNGYYQVNVLLRCSADPRYGLVYAFEPFSALTGDRDLQLANIAVTVGGSVAAGEPIGNLLMVGSAPHVHFGFFDRWQQVCPDPFTAAAVRSHLLALIHQDHPAWGLCE